MSSEIDIKQALSVFQAIVDRGEKRGTKYFWKGVYALSDFDGYNIQLTDDKVTLDIFFHNKYQLASPNNFAREEFLAKLEQLEKVVKAERARKSDE